MCKVKGVTYIALLLMFSWVLLLFSPAFAGDSTKGAVSQKVSVFISALVERNRETVFTMVSSRFLMQEVMQNGEVVSHRSLKEFGDEFDKTSAEFKRLEGIDFNVIQDGPYADAYGKLVRLNGEKSLKGYFWSRLFNVDNGWKIVVFKVEWTDSTALEKAYVTPGPNFNDEIAKLQKWTGISFGEDQSSVLKKFGRPDEKNEEFARYKRKGFTVGYTSQWDLWVESFFIQSPNYKTEREVGVGDSEALIKERYGLGYDMSTWMSGKSKVKTYSYRDYTSSKLMEFKAIDGKITEIFFIDWTQEQKIQR